MLRMLRIILLFIIIVSLGCGDNSIILGLDAEQTGVYKQYGDSYRKGARLALRKINDNGGIKGNKLSLIVTDNQSDPAKARENAILLVKKKKAAALLGSTVVETNRVLAEETNRLKIPMISAAPYSLIALDQKGQPRPYVYNTGFDEKVLGEALANYARLRLKKKKAFICCRSGQVYSEALATAFQKVFHQAGGQIIKFSYKSKITESVVSNIKKSGADLIFLTGSYLDARQLNGLLREQKVKVTLMGPESWDTEGVADMVDFDDVYIGSQGYLNKNSHRTQVFIRDYLEAYGKEPDITAALGYDNMFFLAEALKKSPDYKPETINRAIARTGNFTGVAGDITITPQHGNTRRVSIINIKKGQRVLRGVMYPQG